MLSPPVLHDGGCWTACGARDNDETRDVDNVNVDETTTTQMTKTEGDDRLLLPPTMNPITAYSTGDLMTTVLTDSPHVDLDDDPPPDAYDTDDRRTRGRGHDNGHDCFISYLSFAPLLPASGCFEELSCRPSKTPPMRMLPIRHSHPLKEIQPPHIVPCFSSCSRSLSRQRGRD
jgi:hypothetical protein